MSINNHLGFEKPRQHNLEDSMTQAAPQDQISKSNNILLQHYFKSDHTRTQCPYFLFLIGNYPALIALLHSLHDAHSRYLYITA
jgi:hypothetical protein